MGLSISDLLATTYQSLRSNLLRSGLTTLSMFMGVATVTATMHVKSISEAMIAAELAKRDAPQVGIGVSWSPRRDRMPLKLEEMDVLRQRLNGLRAITAVNWMGIVPVIFQGEEADPSIIAISKDFFVTDGQQLLKGRFFTEADYQSYHRVAVIDQFLVDRLFKGKNPLGQRIYLRGKLFVVVGVVPTKESSNSEPRGLVYIPLAIYSAMTGDRTLDAIQVSPYHIRNLEKLGKQAEKLLKRPGRQLWNFNNAEDILEQQKTLDMAARALTIVAVISLLIGGVGIANVMIGSVTERIPEIGLRRAIGATKPDVMLQFILEAAILSLIGGTSALGTVHGLTVLAADTFKLPYQFEVSTAAIALGSALIVGVGAGLPPALHASHIDPVKALRSE
ncbi:ABC transporter permease [Leptothermofonsia sp. ETS-13]|uniref:ABC transporter permease n=1 Tax=Leptothermofonsia sp. ETS-13 TaxID=3035696 RepID=UPI003BA21B3A